MRRTIALLALAAGCVLPPPVLGAKAQYPEPAHAPLLLYFCPRAAAPTLDGVLDDACWKTAPVITDFGCIHRGEGLARKQAFMQLAYDDEALYVGVRALEPNIEKLKLPTGRDSKIFSGDCVEVYLRPDLAKLTRYQLVANVRGARWDAWITGPARYDKPDVYWGADAKWSAVGHIGKASWTLELRLPYADFGIHARPGSAIGINLVRLTWTVGKEFSAWAHATYEQKDFRYWAFLVFAQPQMDKTAVIERLAPDWRKRLVSWPTAQGLAEIDHGTRRNVVYARADLSELRGLDAAINQVGGGLEEAQAGAFPLKALPKKLADIEDQRRRLASRVREERFSPFGLTQFRQNVVEAACRASDLEWEVRCLRLLMASTADR